MRRPRPSRKEVPYMKFVYPAIFAEREDGSFHVRFPDLEMCEAVGRDEEEALERAKEAERGWIELELSEAELELPSMSAESEIELKPNEKLRNVSVNIRLMEGYDE